MRLPETERTPGRRKERKPGNTEIKQEVQDGDIPISLFGSLLAGLTEKDSLRVSFKEMLKQEFSIKIFSKCGKNDFSLILKYMADEKREKLK